MITVNFIFGILVFRETVTSFWQTMGAFVCLGMGLIGMSLFSAPKTTSTSLSSSSLSRSTSLLIPQSSSEQQQQPPPLPLDNNRHEENDGDVVNEHYSAVYERLEDDDDDNDNNNHYAERFTTNNTNTNRNDNDDDTSIDSNEDVTALSSYYFGWKSLLPTIHLQLSKMTKRKIGIVAAVGNGLFTGSSLVPIHYTKEHGFGGANYMISFACGAFLSNCVLWILYFVVRLSMRLVGCYDQRRRRMVVNNNSNKNCRMMILVLFF